MKTSLRTEIYLWFGGALLLLATAFLSEGSHHSDEHFQILEFAWLMLGNRTAENIPWEYLAQVRPTLQVWVVYFLHEIGIKNPFNLALTTRIISASFALFTSSYLLRLAAEKYGLAHRWKALIFLGLYLWFGIYMMVRFSSENWAGIFITLGLVLYLLKDRRSWIRLILIGILFGLSFQFRYQIAIMLAGFGLWLLIYSKYRLKESVFILFGFGLAFLLGMYSDKAFYGEFVFTPYNYFVQQLVEGKAATFGVEPFWWYFEDIFIRAIPPFSLVLILAFLFFIWKKPKSPITWCIVPFLLVHFIIGHKEERFLYPLIYFLPLVLVLAYQYLDKKYKEGFWKKAGSIFATSFIVINSLLIVVILAKNANENIGLYKTLYYEKADLEKLYYTELNPFWPYSAPITFYKRDQLQLVCLDNIKTTEIEDDIFLYSQGKEQIPKSLNAYNAELIYSTYPDWMWNFNFNNWIERSKPNMLYKLTKK